MPADIPECTPLDTQLNEPGSRGIVRVGPAGWVYPDWNGKMYPKPMPKGIDRLSYIARYFGVVEVNSTFYRPATESTVARWLARTELFPQFRFTVKLWQRFTHERQEAWSRADEREVRIALDQLRAGGKLGAVLVQFPWSFRRSEENRTWLGDVVRAFGDFPLVVEMRNESWNVPEFYGSLVEEGVGFVNIDQPLFKNCIKPSATVTSSVGYVRVHGRNYNNWFRKDAASEERYDYLYSAEALKPWVARTEEIAQDTRETYVVMNNHRFGQAGVNAAMFESMLERKTVDVPPSLYQAYEGELKDYARPAP
ncbi:MAG: DUF72 domain-containing protein [Gemmatimonadaceae bacterium]